MKKFAFGCGGILLVLVFMAVVIAIAVMGKYNALVKLDQSVNQSWAQVQNVYQRRADLIPNLVQHRPGRGEFREVDPDRGDRSARQCRAGADQREPGAGQRAAAGAIPSGTGSTEQRALALAGGGRALSRAEGEREFPGSSRRSSKGRKTASPLSEGISIQTVQAYNTAVRTFPTNLFAGMLGFHPRPFFNAQPGAEKAPEVKFNFGSPAPAPAATAAATP